MAKSDKVRYAWLGVLAAALSAAGYVFAAEADMKKLVVYYSFSGKTEIVAKAAAEEISADMRRIEDLEKPSTFMAYFSGCYRAIKGRTVEIKPMEMSLAGYDTVLLGSPVWAGAPAPAVNAFIDKADFSGKKVVVFVTMGGKNGKSALDRMSQSITKKGGSVVGSFAIQSGGQSADDLAVKAKEAAKDIK